MKICPYCAEEIKDAAIKCKHCHSMLNLPAPVVHERAAPKKPGERSPFDLFIAFLLAGPFMLPMIWMHPGLSRNGKIIGTALVSVVFGLLVWMCVWAIGVFTDYWAMIDRISQP